MIFLLIYVLVYGAAVLGRARLQELNGGPGHVNRNALCAFLACMPLGFLSPGLWLVSLAGILVFQGVRFRRELSYRHRQVQFLRGNGPAPVQR